MADDGGQVNLQLFDNFFNQISHLKSEFIAVCGWKKVVREHPMKELHKGFTRLVGELATPIDVFCTQMIYRHRLLCQCHLLDGKVYPICDPGDLKEF